MEAAADDAPPTLIWPYALLGILAAAGTGVIMLVMSGYDIPDAVAVVGLAVVPLMFVVIVVYAVWHWVWKPVFERQKARR